MAYTYKDRLETVADAILELRWAEMQELAKYIATVEYPDEDEADHPSFWAAIFHDWAHDRMQEYEAKCAKGEAK